jgi:hypothetical protein
MMTACREKHPPESVANRRRVGGEREARECSCDMEKKPLQSRSDVSMARWYKQWTTHTVHPNLKINFFETINTREKAYWLGFLCADGCMIRNNESAEIRLKLSAKDENTIDRFCETLRLDKNKKEYLIDEGGNERAENARNLVLLCQSGAT